MTSTGRAPRDEAGLTAPRRRVSRTPRVISKVIERIIIVRTMTVAGGIQSEAARAGALAATSFTERLRRYEISADFGASDPR